MNTNVARTTAPANSLVARMAERYGVDADKLLQTLKATVIKGDGGKEISNEHLMAFLVIAERYSLNPWLKEIHAFPDKRGGVVPIVGVDGFIKLANTHPQFDSMTFAYDDDKEWVECVISRRDRSAPTRIREYLSECKRNTDPWNQWPQRMLRHRAICQAVRVAFGFAGIMENDEGEAYIEGQVKDVAPRGKPLTAEPRAKQLEAPKAPEISLRTQITQLIDSSGVPESEVLAQFEAGSIDELTETQQQEAVEWLQQVRP